MAKMVVAQIVNHLTYKVACGFESRYLHNLYKQRQPAGGEAMANHLLFKN